MKRIIIVFLSTLLSTAIGVYFRPSYFLVGQMDWQNVVTKGYFLNSFFSFFSQGLLDESFYYVMQFTAAGFVMGLILAYFLGGKATKSAARKKKN